MTRRTMTHIRLGIRSVSPSDQSPRLVFVCLNIGNSIVEAKSLKFTYIPYVIRGLFSTSYRDLTIAS